MRNNIRLKFQKGDFLAIILVLFIAAAAGAAAFGQNTADTQAAAQIYQDGKLIREVSLSENIMIEIAGKYHNVIQIYEGQAAIVESDCPGEDCVHSGWVKNVGRSIICLPNRVEIRIVGDAEVDFSVGQLMRFVSEWSVL